MLEGLGEQQPRGKMNAIKSHHFGLIIAAIFVECVSLGRTCLLQKKSFDNIMFKKTRALNNFLISVKAKRVKKGEGPS